MIRMASLNNSFSYFRDDGKIGNWMVVGEVFVIEQWFFQKGCDNGEF